MMETAIDLIRCVGNDVVEASSTSESSSSTVSAHDLGKIIEEELGGKKDKKIVVVQTKAAGKKKRRGRRRGSAGKVWESKKTFTIKVEELHQVHPAATANDKCRGLAGWRKNHLNSPVVWNSGKDEREELKEENGEEEEEVEDIFRDWLRLQRRGSATEDVNDVFWKIGMSDSGRVRQRRISEVLENLPFDDQPDIFGDRCELLETAPSRAGAIGMPPTKATKAAEKGRGRRLRPQRCYWNIFYEWKKIFNESHSRRQKRKRNFKHRRRPKLPRTAQNGEKREQKDELRLTGGGNDPNFTWSKTTRKRSIATMENYFRDFLHVFEEEGETRGPSSRRRSRDMVDDDEEELSVVLESENIPKRQRVDTGTRFPYRKNWEVIRLESSRTFEMITRNIEKKIREAFREEAESAAARAAGAGEFAEVGRRKLEQSKEQFDSLRRRMQDMRQERRRRSLEGLDEAVFEEWRWNLQEPEVTSSRATSPPPPIRAVVQKHHFQGGFWQPRWPTATAKLNANEMGNRKARFIRKFPVKQPCRRGSLGGRKRERA